MKKQKIITSLLITGVLATNTYPVFASQAIQTQNLTSIEQRISSNVLLKCDQSSINYTNFFKNGGGEQWVKLTLEGAKFNTNDPYEIKNAIKQNYDVQTTIAVGTDGKSIEFGVYEPNAGIEYLPNWEININSSVLTSDTDATIKIPVNYDIHTSATPKIITSKKSITLDELKNGFELDLEGIQGAQFNTDCVGNNVRLSLMHTANIPVMAMTYCDLDTTHIGFIIKALNDIPSTATEFTFRIEGNATTSQVPLLVKLPIVK
ncbi:hypothetical protein [Clostridioides difficile]|uniref:Uncharacterized protein n=4 Tax=Clostridioides difficile TaxID=1496 RepID=A0AAX3H4S3_CLODI|nr:hypothetical protein [Clostridioides difficile]AVD37204.1 hypothetical protein C4E42_16385 [Clostridioides difficile]AVD39344.1 hypothetical protein C4E26_08220 [Clostridioides difficile]AVD42866.1 hypothetical protein C4E25_08230 [Clostridioides difficile]AXU69455.1 hypothetical protein CDIF29020_03203 [Clostridioides difficile]AXU91587.1 hypothetical protein CDIF29747_03117 [Clostridioides difficile]